MSKFMVTVMVVVMVMFGYVSTAQAQVAQVVAEVTENYLDQVDAIDREARKVHNQARVAFYAKEDAVDALMDEVGLTKRERGTVNRQFNKVVAVVDASLHAIQATDDAMHAAENELDDGMRAVLAMAAMTKAKDALAKAKAAVAAVEGLGKVVAQVGCLRKIEPAAWTVKECQALNRMAVSIVLLVVMGMWIFMMVAYDKDFKK